MREWAGATLRYEPESEGWLTIIVERITKRDGSRTAELTATRTDDCHREMVSERDSIIVCTQAWKDVVPIPDHDFYMSPGLKTAWLDTMLRGERLTVRWRAERPCEPGGDRIKMGDRTGFQSVKWGEDASEQRDSIILSRRVTPKSANDEGTC